jgi:hypothetical protein
MCIYQRLNLQTYVYKFKTIYANYVGFLLSTLLIYCNLLNGKIELIQNMITIVDSEIAEALYSLMKH